MQRYGDFYPVTIPHMWHFESAKCGMPPPTSIHDACRDRQWSRWYAVNDADSGLGCMVYNSRIRTKRRKTACERHLKAQTFFKGDEVLYKLMFAQTIASLWRGNAAQICGKQEERGHPHRMTGGVRLMKRRISVSSALPWEQCSGSLSAGVKSGLYRGRLLRRMERASFFIIKNRMEMPTSPLNSEI